MTSAHEVPDDSLPLSARKEQLSLGFVRMITAAAGCSVKVHETDYDGVDLTVFSLAEYERLHGPQFDMQIKCTSRRELLAQDHMAWPMKAAPYMKLINPKRHIPAILGVMLVPPEPEPWLEMTEGGLFTAGRLYWDWAANLGSIPENQGSHTVHLPRSNLFDVQGLLGIMKTIGDGDGDGG